MGDEDDSDPVSNGPNAEQPFADAPAPGEFSISVDERDPPSEAVLSDAEDLFERGLADRAAERPEFELPEEMLRRREELVDEIRSQFLEAFGVRGPIEELEALDRAIMDEIASAWIDEVSTESQ